MAVARGDRIRDHFLIIDHKERVVGCVTGKNGDTNRKSWYACRRAGTGESDETRGTAIGGRRR